MTLTTLLSVTSLLAIFLSFGHLLLKENCKIQRQKEMMEKVTQSLHKSKNQFHITRKHSCGESYLVRSTKKDITLEYKETKTTFKKIL
jgi:hypothetical protein